MEIFLLSAHILLLLSFEPSLMASTSISSFFNSVRNTLLLFLPYPHIKLITNSRLLYLHLQMPMESVPSTPIVAHIIYALNTHLNVCCFFCLWSLPSSFSILPPVIYLFIFYKIHICCAVQCSLIFWGLLVTCRIRPFPILPHLIALTQF